MVSQCFSEHWLALIPPFIFHYDSCMFRVTPLDFLYSEVVKRHPFFYISRIFDQKIPLFLNFKDMRSWLKTLSRFQSTDAYLVTLRVGVPGHAACF